MNGGLIIVMASALAVGACAQDDLLTPLVSAQAGLDLAANDEPDLEDDCADCQQGYDTCELQCTAGQPSPGPALSQCLLECQDGFEACWDEAGCDNPAGDACQVVTSALDIDVPRVFVTGLITVEQPVAGVAGQSALIELHSERHGVVYLGYVQTGSYSRWIVPGRYDIVYRHVGGTVLPQNSFSILEEDVLFGGVGTRDIHVPRDMVRGNITLNGAAPPASIYERGEIRFRDVVTGRDFRVGSSNAGSYGAAVLPGVYDVLWAWKMGGNIVPRNPEALLLEDVVIDGNTELDVDVPVVEIEGEMRFNGALAPASVYENGRISFRLSGTEAFPVSETRLQTYSVRVVPGTYDVLYSHLLGDTIVPRNEAARVDEEVALLASGDLDLDMTVRVLGGEFTLDGGNFPASVYNRARLSLLGEEPADLFPLGTTTPVAEYEVRIIPGTYDVVYEGLTSTGAVPVNPYAVISTGHSLGKGFLRSSGVFDIDVDSGWLEVAVTTWGEDPLQSVYHNGDIFGLGASGELFEVGMTMDAGGTVRVVAGEYDVHYGHRLGDLVPINGNAAVGAGEAALLALPVDVDLEHGPMWGDFSMGGADFPAVNTQRGRLSLRDVETGDEIVLAGTELGGYEQRLLAGSYLVIYDQVAGTTVPYNKDAILGCVTFEPPAPSGN